MALQLTRGAFLLVLRAMVKNDEQSGVGRLEKALGRGAGAGARHAEFWKEGGRSLERNRTDRTLRPPAPAG